MICDACGNLADGVHDVEIWMVRCPADPEDPMAGVGAAPPRGAFALWPDAGAADMAGAPCPHHPRLPNSALHLCAGRRFKQVAAGLGLHRDTVYGFRGDVHVLLKIRAAFTGTPMNCSQAGPVRHRSAFSCSASTPT